MMRKILSLRQALVLVLGQLLGSCVVVVLGTPVSSPVPDPNVAQGQPFGSSAAAISQYAVNSLPHVEFPIPHSWAGNIPIGKGFGNDTLFFWLWEAEQEECVEDLIIWLQGGPACSSLLGLFKENGPVLFSGNSTTPVPNPHSWTKLANLLYVDQPVGTGFSYGNPGATGNTQDTAAFVQWLESFFAVFPGLRSKKIHLMGENFAGIFIPYIARAIQQHESLGIKITSIGLGDSTWGNAAALTDIVATTFIKEHIHRYETKMPGDVLSVLEKADEDCGFTNVLSQLTYPATSEITIPGHPENSNYKLKVRNEANLSPHVHRYPRVRSTRSSAPQGYDPDICDFDNGTHTPAQLSFLINGTDPGSCFGSCATYDAAFNWLADARDRCFNPYNIADRCGSGLYSDNAYAAYLNLPEVKEAFHAPASIDFQSCNVGLKFDLSSPEKRVEPPAYKIIPELLAAGVKVNVWAGKLDYIIIPLGQELVIQNMTWNALRGFRQPPKMPFFDVWGSRAGIFGSERGLSYHLFDEAGHRVPQDRPAAAFQFVKSSVVMR